MLLRHVAYLHAVRAVQWQEQLFAAGRSGWHDSERANRPDGPGFPSSSLVAARHSAQRPRGFATQVWRLATSATTNVVAPNSARKHQQPTFQLEGDAGRRRFVAAGQT